MKSGSVINHQNPRSSRLQRGFCCLTGYHQLHALIEAGKPKWQRWATFNRLEDRFERVNEQVNRSLLVLIQRLQSADKRGGG